jgi:hypothetical protein
MRHLLCLMATVAACLPLLAGCTLGRDAIEGAQAKEGFTQCTPDPRILCEAGSEKLALRLQPMLDDALTEVAQAQLGGFAAPVQVTTYNSVESFTANSGAAHYAQGALGHGSIHFSPTLLDTPGRTHGLLLHELSHLHLYQQIGPLAWGRLPSWFHEGLATAVSGGGGAETFSEVDALYSMASGQCFMPEESAWPLFPKKGASYGLNPHMFYRQAGMFVTYLRSTDPQAFKRLLTAVEARQDFAGAVRSSYGPTLQPQWQQFLSHSRGAFVDASARRIDAMCARRS